MISYLLKMVALTALFSTLIIYATDHSQAAGVHFDFPARLHNLF